MALPIDFITRTRALLGEEFDRLEAALNADVPVSIRINSMKGTPAPKAGAPVAWCESGFYLPERLSFTFDPLFHAGAYYVQEASSMFLEQAIKAYVKEPVRCLDLCAAPGGKSTHLASLLPDGSLLVSNEVIRSRSYVLAENIAKWGRPDTIVINNDPEEIGEALPHLFDVLVTRFGSKLDRIAMLLLSFFLQFCFVALFIHDIGIVQLPFQIAQHGINVFPPQGGALHLLPLRQPFGAFCLLRQFVDPVYLLLFHIYSFSAVSRSKTRSIVSIKPPARWVAGIQPANRHPSAAHFRMIS